ncbi:MAG: lamin tail domain-containing protein [Crocinitomicaceae bacterium]|nr:lamin tail domain-containing protein [Crocinitomicaceae bacterium]
MRFCLTFLLFAVNPILWGQFSDDFEDGDFSNAPTWTGNTANFIVNGNNELQLNAPAVTDTSYLSVPTTNISNTTWDFYVRMEFNPSSSNFSRVYLVSDNTDLKGSLNGYYVMLGGTTDEISLYRQDGLATTEILDGLDGALNSDPSISRVRVTRDGAGNWELLRDTTGGYNFISEGTVSDATHTTNSNFGVFCRYTSTRSTDFYFDNLGDPYIDSVIPTIDTVIVISSTELDVQFSEAMDQGTAETTTNYSLDQGIGSPVSTLQDAGDPALIHLTFGTPFVSGTNYILTVSNVEDLGGNAVNNPTTYPFDYFVPDVPLPGELLITEFMADPTPSVGLPEVEYIELFNPTTKFFDLSGWTLSDGSSTGVLNSYIIGPLQYVLICNTGDCGQFFVTNFTETSLPSLNNSADNIVLKYIDGTTIDSLSFDLSWYNDPSKEDGGWSIEKKYYTAPCQVATNWAASTDPLGGTPATQNSVYTNQPDNVPPAISNYTVNGDSNVVVVFNEVLDTSYTAIVGISPSVSSLSWNYNSLMELNIDIQTLAVNQIYEITISGATDCSANPMNTSLIDVGIPDTIVQGDIILNEVMFNPLTGGSDYVEVYNHSDKILDLQEVFLANWDDSIANYKSLITEQYLFLPGEYVLITEDTNDIINDFTIYGVGTFIEADLPTYPNDSGTVYLLSKDSLLLDYFHYDEDYHFDLISDEDGKSLERLSFDGAMNDPDIWHTAAEYVEWGTPGYENSQQLNPEIDGEVSIDPKIFSPDNDGYQDVISINVALTSTDNVVDVEIFDNRGRLIRLLKDNYFVGNEATFTWDGINDEGEKATIGTYIILVSVVDENGNQQQYKLVAVLAGKL